MTIWNRRKSIEGTPHAEGQQLRRTLGWTHLVALGVGAIVGTGIYTLIGVGAGLAGPGLLLGFLIAGIVCACAALAYAELATLMPTTGSAYTYSYSILNEPVAWFVGWALILEYTVVCAAVAVGWAGHANGFLASVGFELPAALAAGPDKSGGVINLPAVFIAFMVAGLLAAGTKASATLNAFLVIVKIAALVLFVALALPAFDEANLAPFMPHGFAPHVDPDGVTRGVMAAAAIIFFAFYGFDAVSTAAEEAKNPGRDLVIGIVGSMAACTLIYIAVGAAAVGALPYGSLASSEEPLAHVMRAIGRPAAAQLIELAAVIALPTVILAFMYGQSRIFFAMARDGLLPRRLAQVSARTGTPIGLTFGTAAIVSLLAGLLPLGEIAGLANAGTLCAFVAIAVCMLVLRTREPNRPRKFQTPLPWIVGPIAILGCIYLFASLPEATRERFYIWIALGVIAYLGYGMRRSPLAPSGPATPPSGS